jgi:hypothetical protein
VSNFRDNAILWLIRFLIAICTSASRLLLAALRENLHKQWLPLCLFPEATGKQPALCIEFATAWLISLSWHIIAIATRVRRELRSCWSIRATQAVSVCGVFLEDVTAPYRRLASCFRTVLRITRLAALSSVIPAAVARGGTLTEWQTVEVAVRQRPWLSRRSHESYLSTGRVLG